MKEIALRLILFFWERPLKTRKKFLPLFRGMLKLFGSKTLFSDIEKECHFFKKEATAELKNDILSSLILYGADPKEYFLYGFPAFDEKERDTFLTDHYRIQVLKREIGIQYFKNELINKSGFYNKNKRFFGRECLLITPDTNFDDFLAYVQKVGGKVFVKDNRGSFGSQGRVITYKSEDSLREDFSKLVETNSEWIAEGFIIQDKGLACWNSSSVNTIRIPSFLTSDGVQILGPFIRTGRVGSCVDNADSGGIFAVIDEKTGEIITDGADKFGNVYIEHPDSKIVYKGWQVPQWEKLLSIASEAHKLMPKHKYIGYDFALTPSGWIMVEGNWGQYLAQQVSTKKGYKDSFIRLICGK